MPDTAPDPPSLSLAEPDTRPGGPATDRPAADTQAGRADADALGQTRAWLIRAAQEETAAAVEAERRRLAALLETNVVEPLNLLLAQAAAYEQSLAGQPARLAVSVLASLARQVMQQARGLEAGLHPALLEALGLEPALEALAAQVMQTSGLRVELAPERLPQRLPPSVELALFRTVQAALERASGAAHASWLGVRLEQRAGEAILYLADDGVAAVGQPGEGLSVAGQRLEQLGAVVEIRWSRGLELTARLACGLPAELTPRELEVIRMLAGGLSNKQIARRLSITPRTVNFHLDNIYSKLGVNSRLEAAVYALRQGWVPADLVK